MLALGLRDCTENRYSEQNGPTGVRYVLWLGLIGIGGRLCIVAFIGALATLREALGCEWRPDEM